MEDAVAIACNGVEHHFPIEDVLPDILKDTFELNNEPKILYQCDTNLVVPYKKWSTKLKPGCSYYIKNNKENKKVQKDESLDELILNSLIASTAVYHISNELDNEDICKEYLMEQIDNHHFDYLIPSKHGENVYLIAKELDTNRIYIAFRGTKELSDWKYNLQADRESSSSSLIPGKFHSGFLQRAQMFPIDKILHEDRFKDMDVIVCGHSLGGSVASIVSIRLQTQKVRYKLYGTVKCITFGAPLFGDAMLQKSIDCKNIHHFVCNNDPVPYLLSYTQTMSSILLGIDSQITSLAHLFSTSEGMSYHKKHAQDLLNKKMEYKQVISKITPLIGSILEATTLIYPAMKWASDVKRIFSVVNDIKSSTSMCQNVYVPIGNFYFLDDRKKFSKTFEYHDLCFIEDQFESYFKTHQEDIKPDAHTLTNYNHLLRTLNEPKITFSCYNAYEDDVNTIQSEYVIPKLRNVRFQHIYTPVIHSVKLAKVESRDKTILRLSFTGLHLFEIVLQKCKFNFNFPYCTNQDTTTIKRVSMGENEQRVILEEAFKENISISDHGTNLVYVTQFGVCEKIIHREDLRNIAIQSVTQISRHDSVSLLVRRAIQRGMALSKIKMEGSCGSPNIIIQEIKELGNIALGYEAMKEMQVMFDDNAKDFRFIMSNEEAFEKVKQFSEKIEQFLRSPMEIQAEWSVIQKIGFGLTVAFGAAAAGYIAGPGLVIVGVANAASAAAATLGGMFGAGAAAGAANFFLKDQLTDSVYENALKWINQQLIEANQGCFKEEIQLQILDFQDDGSIYSNEKILMLLADENDHAVNTFGESTLNKCTEKTKVIVRHRIEAVKKIHKIREIFAQQCFIGVIGLQDAGKTTLLKKIWNVGGNTGFFIHTDVPLLYEITSKLLVVDFPGSNSLDYHAKTFSICGAMNNMVIVLIPFTGDISKVVSDEVQNVFSVMKGSESTKVLLCINKCGLHLERLKDQLKAEESPIGFLKKRFINKLNEHYENTGKGINIKCDDIMFTDWETGDDSEAKDFGIVGVEAVKTRIKDYLISYGIYKEEETAELRRCLSTSTHI